MGQNIIQRKHVELGWHHCPTFNRLWARHPVVIIRKNYLKSIQTQRNLPLYCEKRLLTPTSPR